MKGTVIFLAMAAAAAAHSTVLWDFGPSTGTNSGSWQNQTALQNFADNVIFTSAVQVTRYQYFTSFDPTTFGTMHLKLLADNAGTPGAVLNGQDITMTSWTPEGGVNKVILDLTTPWNLSAGTTYWVGASGNGFEAAQVSLQTPGDGMMAQFSGTTFVNMATVGDQAFRLEGSVVPEPASMAALGLGALALIRRRRSAK